MSENQGDIHKKPGEEIKPVPEVTKEKLQPDNLNMPPGAESRTPQASGQEPEPGRTPSSNVPETPGNIGTNPPPPKHEPATVIASGEPKKFKHYLFEFFMLFLAVFCGFFAEYKLEQLIEDTKEKQYIESITRDLAEDTVKINSVNYSNYWLINGLDSLEQAIYGLDPNDLESVRQLYRLYVAWGRNEYLVKFTDRTLAPLKNSGNFRIIRSQAVSDSLMRYDDQMKFALDAAARYSQYYQYSLNISTEIFDYQYLRFNYTQNQYMASLSTAYPVLLNSDKYLLSKYANSIELWKQMIVSYNWSSYYVKLYGVRLIPFLKQEYRIDPGVTTATVRR